MPQLELNNADQMMWLEDEDEYVRCNLDLEVTGFDTEMFTARKSALNALGCIAQRIEEPAEAAKKKGHQKGKGKEGQGLRLKKQVSACQKILNYVDGANSKLSSSIAALATDASATSEAKQALEEQYQRERYAMLLVYGAIAEPMSEKSQGSAISNFVRTFILPACDTRGVTLAFPDWKVEQNRWLRQMHCGLLAVSQALCQTLK